MIIFQFVDHLGDDAGLDPGELLVPPLVYEGVGHDVHNDGQLTAPGHQKKASAGSFGLEPRFLCAAKSWCDMV